MLLELDLLDSMDNWDDFIPSFTKAFALTIQVDNLVMSDAVAKSLAAPEDLLDWMMYANSTTSHLTNSSNPTYTVLDADKIWLIKGSAGNPWDIDLFDEQYIYLWITENGDAGQCGPNPGDCWSVATAYKRFNIDYPTPRGNPTPQGVPWMPRYFVPHSVVTLDTAGPTNLFRTTSCDTDSQSPFSIGNIRCITQGPVTMSWGGDIGTQPTIWVEYYYGSSYNARERFYWVKNFGLVKWDVASLSGGSYVVSQTSLHVTIAAGGAPRPNFPCYPTSWWVGVPPSTPTRTLLYALGDDLVMQDAFDVLYSQRRVIASDSVNLWADVAQNRIVTVQLALSDSLNLWQDGPRSDNVNFAESMNFWRDAIQQVGNINTAAGARQSQLPIKIIAYPGNLPRVRESQLVGKVLEFPSNVPAVRESQLVIKELSTNKPSIRMSQLVIKICVYHPPLNSQPNVWINS